MAVNFSDMMLSTRMEAARVFLIDMAPGYRLAFTTDRLACCHLVLAGELELHSPDAEPMRLEPGDFVLALRFQPREFVLANATRTAHLSMRTYPQADEAHRIVIGEGSGNGGGAKVLSGCFGLDQMRDATEAAAVTCMTKIKVVDTRYPPFLNCPDVAAFEASCFGVGARAYIASVLRLLYVQTVRERLARSLTAESIDLKLLGLPQISTARRLIDANPGAPWRLSTLAQSVGMSRTVFAEKFASAVGEPPMHYVTRTRLERAVELLAAGISVNEVAARVGYAAPSAFSRAFRRQFSGSPRRFLDRSE